MACGNPKPTKHLSTFGFCCRNS